MSHYENIRVSKRFSVIKNDTIGVDVFCPYTGEVLDEPKIIGQLPPLVTKLRIGRIGMQDCILDKCLYCVSATITWFDDESRGLRLPRRMTHLSLASNLIESVTKSHSYLRNVKTRTITRIPSGLIHQCISDTMIFRTTPGGRLIYTDNYNCFCLNDVKFTESITNALVFMKSTNRPRYKPKSIKNYAVLSRTPRGTLIQYLGSNGLYNDILCLTKHGIHPRRRNCIEYHTKMDYHRVTLNSDDEYISGTDTSSSEEA